MTPARDMDAPLRPPSHAPDAPSGRPPERASLFSLSRRLACVPQWT